MDTVLRTPEEVICEQDADPTLKPEDDAMYFIAKGSCKVTVADKFTDRFESRTSRIIEKGGHFGEISMLYQCRRSATVTSIQYL